MKRFEIKNCNAILTEKQQKYQHYLLEKLINMNILQVKKYCLLNKSKLYNKLTPLGKAFEKETQKQVCSVKSLDPSNKLKRIEGIFPQHLMNYLICAKLTEIV